MIFAKIYNFEDDQVLVYLDSVEDIDEDGEEVEKDAVIIKTIVHGLASDIIVYSDDDIMLVFDAFTEVEAKRFLEETKVEAQENMN